MRVFHLQNACGEDCRRTTVTAPRGVTLVELLVAVVLMTASVGLIASMTIRIHHVWKEVSYRRVALAELNNQLEHLTRLPPQDLPQAIDNLQASKACLTMLSGVTLEGDLTDDQLGTRITLRINWQRKVPGLPLRLSGWSAQPSIQGSPSRSSPGASADANDDSNDLDNDTAMRFDAVENFYTLKQLGYQP